MQTRLRSLTLYEQCHLFDERRAALTSCAAESTCDAFASCTVALSRDDWSMKDSPSLCDAFARRRAGLANGAIQERLRALDPPKRRKVMVALYELDGRCTSDASVRKRVAACMDEGDARFAACVVDLVGGGR